MCLRTGRGGEDVGISNRRGARCKSPLSRTRGVREVSATCNSHSVAEADGSLVLPEVLRPAPGEGISAGLVIPHVSEVLQGASVGKDVEEAQELPVNAPRGRHDARQEGVCGALPVGIRLAIPCHLGARRGLEELVDVVVAQLPVAVKVPTVVAAELVGAGNVDDQMPVTTKVDILDEEVAATGLAAGLPHRRDVASLCDEASFMADRLQGIQNRLVGILRAAGVLPAGVDVVAVQVDDVPMAGADEGRMRLVAALAWPVCILLTGEQKQLRDQHS